MTKIVRTSNSSSLLSITQPSAPGHPDSPSSRIETEKEQQQQVLQSRLIKLIVNQHKFQRGDLPERSLKSDESEFQPTIETAFKIMLICSTEPSNKSYDERTSRRKGAKKLPNSQMIKQCTIISLIVRMLLITNSCCVSGRKDSQNYIIMKHLSCGNSNNNKSYDLNFLYSNLG